MCRRVCAGVCACVCKCLALFLVQCCLPGRLPGESFFSRHLLGLALVRGGVVDEAHCSAIDSGSPLCWAGTVLNSKFKFWVVLHFMGYLVKLGNWTKFQTSRNTPTGFRTVYDGAFGLTPMELREALNLQVHLSTDYNWCKVMNILNHATPRHK